MSLLQIVGAAPSKLELAKLEKQANKKDVETQPVVVKKKGALLQWFEETEKEKMELEQRKLEKMNEIYAQRMVEKKAKQMKA